MERMNVARFWNESIDTVELEWTYIDYVDRREYMWVHSEITDRFDAQEDD